MKKKVVFCSVILIILISAFALSGTDVPGAVNEDARMSDTAFAATVEYGGTYEICPELIQALIETESSGNPNAVNGNCKGLCQIYEKYHRGRMDRLGAWDLHDERSNILVAVDYLSELFQEYGDVCLVLDIYNGNSSAEYNHKNGIISDYAESILRRSAELERLHGK